MALLLQCIYGFKYFRYNKIIFYIAVPKNEDRYFIFGIIFTRFTLLSLSLFRFGLYLGPYRLVLITLLLLFLLLLLSLPLLELAEILLLKLGLLFKLEMLVQTCTYFTRNVW